jgi:hypothetical protein
MFGATGAGMSKIKHMQNGGKRARRSIDQWDRVRTHDWYTPQRDGRLTGGIANDGPRPKIDRLLERTVG